ncbi:phage holin family protein [Janibacter sp. GS2]|uniref:phage holin family protein n=1 Tax=Janibacter sp. GS2 TaxID=3442646 RepID=UPI003EC0CD55
MAEPVRPQAQDASTGELISRLSEQTSTLIRDEMRLAQAEFSAKAKHAGVGVGMFGAGGLLAFFGAAALVATAILALALVLPAWAAALIVGAVLLMAAAVVSLLGKKQVEQAAPLKPERAMANVQRDVTEVKEASSREHD